MPDAKTKFEDMLFDYSTTYLTDYRRADFVPPVATKYREKPISIAVRLNPLKDIHTMSDWKAAAIPFDLLHKNRPIIATNPWHTQKKYENSTADDAERELVVKTRPRLVLTPAVSMDDIENPRARRILCEDMYTSDATRSQRGTVAGRVNVQAPFPQHPAPANPITLRKLQPSFVSPEWRMETVKWDNKQLRTHCDPSREFWLAFELPK